MVLWEDKLRLTPWWKNVISGKDNFGGGVLKGVSNPGRHHEIALLGKCHYKSFVTVFWL